MLLANDYKERPGHNNTEPQITITGQLPRDCYPGNTLAFQAAALALVFWL